MKMDKQEKQMYRAVVLYNAYSALGFLKDEGIIEGEEWDERIAELDKLLKEKE